MRHLHYQLLHLSAKAFCTVTRIVVACVLLWGSAHAQTDSLWFEGKLYPRDVYERIRSEHERKNFETYFMPGISYVYFSPQATDSIGRFGGICVEYLLYADVTQNDKYGPSHTRFYTKLNILNAQRDGINSIFMYGLGLDLSLERNPNRNYMIPYFGLELGGISQRPLGSSFQFTPTLGIHFLSKKNLFINAHGGYVYPVRNFDLLRGWFIQSGFNFVLW